jgi:xanthine dehydrogenase YagR molybdenum-binding subunit
MMSTRLIGAPVNRVDGRQKVTGTAQYAAEMVLGNMAFGVLVGSPVAGGTIRKLSTAEAEKASGVLAVITSANRGPLGKLPASFMEGGAVVEARPPLEDERIHHVGQYIALVVAETSEQAHHAVSLLEAEYENASFAVDLQQAAQTRYKPRGDGFGEPLEFGRGDIEAALEAAHVRIDVTYSTPNEHPCALEPHASIASWSGDELTIYNATQWVQGDRNVLASAFGLPPEKIRVLCPFTGGMFGSKALTGPHTILAAVAARKLNRPVKIVLTRRQVLVNVGHRSETVQRMELAALRDGTLTGLRHHVTSHTSLNDEFPEPASISTRMLYEAPSYATSHELLRLNIVKPSWMRAPGEAPGQFAIECAMDELAVALEMDPVALRVKNHAAVNPHTRKPFSSKHLLDCYERGAQRFGWNKRNHKPRSMREGRTLMGWGMATATYPGYLMGAGVTVRLERDASDVRAAVSTAGSDVGTGMYTMLTLTVADALGLPIDRVRVDLGDSSLSQCAVAGGSNLTASTAPAATLACTQIKDELLKIASHTADGFTGAEGKRDEFIFENGRIAPKAHPGESIGYRDLMTLGGRDSIETQGATQPIFGQNDQFSFQSFGADFVEVRIDEELGRVKVSRVVSVFDCGRIINPTGARSQFIGGIVFGIGQALLEELIFDPARGQAWNADLAGYLVPVHADVPEIDVSWIGEPDYNFNALGCRGVGEIGITGVAAAIANAVYHATGVRIRNLPITPDKLLLPN